MDQNCIFCQIATGQVPAFKIYEDQFVVAFLDRYPKTKGTVNIAVKRHATYLYELSESEFQSLVVAIAKVMGSIKVVYDDCNGYSILSNEGPGSGAQIQHLFFQLVPRYGSPEKDTASLQGYSQENSDPFLKKVFDELSGVLNLTAQVANQSDEVKKEQEGSNIQQPKIQEQQFDTSALSQIATLKSVQSKQQISLPKQPPKFTTIPSESIDATICEVADISTLEKEISALNAKIKNLKNSCSWE